PGRKCVGGCVDGGERVLVGCGRSGGGDLAVEGVAALEGGAVACRFLLAVDKQGNRRHLILQGLVWCVGMGRPQMICEANCRDESPVHALKHERRGWVAACPSAYIL